MVLLSLLACPIAGDPALEARLDVDRDGFRAEQFGGEDCDDADPEVNPDAVERWRDGVDQDCDGAPDYDEDRDGADDPAGGGSDCDDQDAAVHPGATEDPTNPVDEDCNGVAEQDLDGDGQFSLATGGTDCDDLDGDTFDGAAPMEGDGCFTDVDGDDWGDEAPLPAVTPGLDCVDTDAAISPSAIEACGEGDEDCDGTVDEDDAAECVTYYFDADGDGYGADDVAGRCRCQAGDFYTAAEASDCYDGNAEASPDHTTYEPYDRGDGSYDWNCDGSESLKWTATEGGCGDFPACPESLGWTGSSAPGCGEEQTYFTGCHSVIDLPPYCDEETEKRTQECQ